jgi:putative phosphonate metabolism protein
MRVAVFFTPPPEHPLTRAAALWLGRDPFSGEEFPPSARDDVAAGEIASLTAAPRRYGFHATLKPPFRLAGGCRLEDVDLALDEAARGLAPVDLGRLSIAEIGSFFALIPATEGIGLQEFAGEIVRRFDRFRAPPTPDEIARRRPERLSPRQRENLTRWGYPYVFEDFRFHMTLTGPVAERRRAEVRRVLEDRFRPLVDTPVVVDALALFVELTPPGDFMVRKRVAMRRAPQPVSAA